LAANSTLTSNYAGGQPITPETKWAIAEEVRRQIDVLRMEQNQVSSSGGSVTTIFSDNAQHVFVSNSSYLYNSDAGECTVNEGDVLVMTGAPPANAVSTDVVVLSSRGQDCARGSTVSVPLQDLQEMHNAMMATVDRGLGEMQAKQGQDGIPALPAGSTGTIDSPLSYAAEAQPDENVAGELDGVIQETDRAEQEAIDQVATPASTKLTFSSTGPVNPTLIPGLSIDQAKAIQGEPQRIVEVGNRKIYVYKQGFEDYVYEWAADGHRVEAPSQHPWIGTPGPMYLEESCFKLSENLLHVTNPLYKQGIFVQIRWTHCNKTSNIQCCQYPALVRILPEEPHKINRSMAETASLRPSTGSPPR
jgi:hypothetical protein